MVQRGAFCHFKRLTRALGLDTRGREVGSSPHRAHLEFGGPCHASSPPPPLPRSRRSEVPPSPPPRRRRYRHSQEHIRGAGAAFYRRQMPPSLGGTGMVRGGVRGGGSAVSPTVKNETQPHSLSQVGVRRGSTAEMPFKLSRPVVYTQR